MSCYVYETRQPSEELCPFHKVKFKNKSKSYYACPEYHQCGYSIGSRKLVGQITRMWVQQSKRGKKFVKEYYDDMRRCCEIVPYPEPEPAPTYRLQSQPALVWGGPPLGSILP